MLLGGRFLQNYDGRDTDLLIGGEFYIVSHHLSDDSDWFVGTVLKGVIVYTALSYSSIVIRFEGDVVFLRYELRLQEYILEI